MKIKLYISIFCSIVLLSGTASCERSFLYPWPPDGARTPEDVWSYYDYSKGFLDAVSADNLSLCITSEVEGYGTFASASDEAEHSNPSGKVQYFTNGIWNPTNVPNVYYGGPWAGTASRIPWANAYQAIRRVNIFLENVDNSALIDDPTNPARRYERTYEKGYAYFLRAWFQFDLFRKYGGFPIVKKSLTTEDDLFFPRNTLEECYQAIIEDIDKAMELLPIIWDDNNWGKASRSAAQALKARLMLYYASPLYQGKFEEFGIAANTTGDVERWKNAAKAAREMINQNDFYSLIPVTSFVAPYTGTGTYTQIGMAINLNQREYVMFQPASANKSYLDELYNLPTGQEGCYGYTNPTQEMVDAFEVVTNHNTANVKSVPFDWNNPAHANNPYANRDPRFYASIMYNGRVWGNSATFRYPVDTYEGGMHRQPTNPNSTKTGYYMSKYFSGNYYAYKTGFYTSASRHKLEIRLAEIVLNYAEAMNEAYGPTGAESGGEPLRIGASNALEAVNLIRARVKMPLLKGSFSKDEMREKIKHERRIELCFEGHRMYDLRRWKEGSKLGESIHGVKIQSTGTDNNGRPTGFSYQVEKVEDRVWRDCMYWWPIPYAEIVKYSGALAQNPGWDKK